MHLAYKDCLQILVDMNKAVLHLQISYLGCVFACGQQAHSPVEDRFVTVYRLCPRSYNCHREPREEVCDAVEGPKRWVCLKGFRTTWRSSHSLLVPSHMAAS